MLSISGEHQAKIKAGKKRDLKTKTLREQSQICTFSVASRRASKRKGSRREQQASSGVAPSPPPAVWVIFSHIALLPLEGWKWSSAATSSGRYISKDEADIQTDQGYFLLFEISLWRNSYMLWCEILTWNSGGEILNPGGRLGWAPIQSKADSNEVILQITYT